MGDSWVRRSVKDWDSGFWGSPAGRGGMHCDDGNAADTCEVNTSVRHCHRVSRLEQQVHLVASQRNPRQRAHQRGAAQLARWARRSTPPSGDWILYQGASICQEDSGPGQGVASLLVPGPSLIFQLPPSLITHAKSIKHQSVWSEKVLSYKWKTPQKKTETKTISLIFMVFHISQFLLKIFFKYFCLYFCIFYFLES